MYNDFAVKVDNVIDDVFLEVTAAEFEDFGISSSSDIVATTGQRLNVQFQMQFDLSVGELVAVKFPYLNDEAPTSSLISMVDTSDLKITGNVPYSSLEFDETV